MKRRKKSFWLLRLFLLIPVLLFFTSQVQAVDVTDEQFAAAMQGGQKYLFDNFHDNGDGTGYFGPGGYKLATTGSAVSALLETGKYSDPAYAAIIDKAIAYIKTFVKADGSIYDSNITYETGISITALALYGKAKAQDAAYVKIVQDAVNYLLNCQNTSDGWAKGGWGYDASYKTGNWSDMSNTQFATMGLFYGSRYLGLPIKGQTWATNLLKFVTACQRADGAIDYQPDYGNVSKQTGGGLWCLAMIDEAALGAGTVAQKAIDWYNTNYNATVADGTFDNGWENSYYGNFAWAKALTAVVGTANKVGTHNWVQDLKNHVWNQISTAKPPVPQTTPVTPCGWEINGSADYQNATMNAAWVLTGASFADPNTPSEQKFVPERPDTDTPPANQGLVTLETTGGVLISKAQRGLIGHAKKAKEVILPVGSFDFTLINIKPVGGKAVVKIVPPAGALDPNNADSFINKDGTIKDGLNWFKVQGGEWKGLASVPIKLMPAGGPYQYIEVTLTDGGPEDADGLANGTIVDPGAPGAGAAPAPAPTPGPTDGSGSSGCFIATAAYGSYMADDVMILRVFRDRHLLTNPVGRAFVAFYYTVSPPIANVIAKYEPLKAMTRIALWPVVAGVKHPMAAMLFFGGFLVAGAGMIAYRRRKEN